MIQLKRTANAGFLLSLDGISVLLDGVCSPVFPYLGTPDYERSILSENYPDIIAFTHSHKDHFDPNYARYFQQKTGRPILGTIDLVDALPDCNISQTAISVGSVQITPIQSKHLGNLHINHFSFIIKGSMNIWFLGDASPLQWNCKAVLPSSDILIAPFPYITTQIGLRALESFSPNLVIVTHLPAPEFDPDHLWYTIEKSLCANSHLSVAIPKIGETVY